MRIKIKFQGGKLLAVCMLVLLSSTATFAALNVEPKNITNVTGTDITSDVLNPAKNLIDAYYEKPAIPSNPSDITGKLGIAASAADYDNAPADYGGYKSGNYYYFVRDAVPENAAKDDSKVHIRVWSSTPNLKGGYYSDVSSFDNSETMPPLEPLTVQTQYKADTPYKPEITQFDEFTTTLADGTVTRALKVTSAQPAATDGIRGVTEYKWKIGKSEDINAAVEVTVAGNILVDGITIPVTDVGSVLKINTAGIPANTTLWFWASHTNWFTTAGTDNYSDWKSHKIGGGGVAPTPVYSFPLPAGFQPGGGIYARNMISLPSNLDYTNGQQIVEDINTAAGKVVCFEIDRLNPDSQMFESVAYFPDFDMWIYDRPGTDPAGNPYPQEAFPIAAENKEGFIIYINDSISQWTPKTK